MSIHSLNKDMYLETFSHLNVSDLGKCSQVCKLWNSVASEDVLWKKIAERMFIQEIPRDNIMNFVKLQFSLNDQTVARICAFINKVKFGENGQLVFEDILLDYLKLSIRVEIMGNLQSDNFNFREVEPKLTEIKNKGKCFIYPLAEYVSKANISRDISPCFGHHKLTYTTKDAKPFRAFLQFPLMPMKLVSELTAMEKEIDRCIKMKLEQFVEESRKPKQNCTIQ